MARVLIKCWSRLQWDGTWKQSLQYYLSDNGLEYLVDLTVAVSDGATAAQIKTAVSDAIRLQAVNEQGTTAVETNQIIWPDASRS